MMGQDGLYWGRTNSSAKVSHVVKLTRVSHMPANSLCKDSLHNCRCRNRVVFCWVLSTNPLKSNKKIHKYLVRFHTHFSECEDESLLGYSLVQSPWSRHVSEERHASIIRAIIIVLMMEAVRTSETSGYSDETTRRYTPDGCNLRTQLLIVKAGGICSCRWYVARTRPKVLNTLLKYGLMSSY
jgi:hypothetical protein